MAHKPKAPRPSQADRAAEQANYADWKILAGADQLERHDVKPGTIPERLWRRLYIQGRSPQDAADQAAVSAYNARPAANRLKRRWPTSLPFKVVRINSIYEVLARAANLMIARVAYREAARMYPDDKVLLYEGAQVIEKSK
jgi:hypothetical protein